MAERIKESQNWQNNDEISLNDILAIVRRRYLIAATVMVAFTLIGLFYSVLTKPLYTATVVVQPATEQGGALSGISGRLGNIAGLAGLDIAGGKSDRELYLAVLQSRSLATTFIHQYNLKPLLFPERWQESTKSWKGEGESGGAGGRRLPRLGDILVSLSGDEGRLEWTPEPSDWEAYEAFRRIRTIKEDTNSGMVEVSFNFRDPTLAAKWVNDYVAMANAEIRERVISEASRALDYLDARVEETSINALRQNIFALIERQLEAIMLAKARPDYAFRVIDSAVVPRERSFPNRIFIVMVSFILGSVVGIGAAVIVDLYRRPVSYADQ